MQPTLALFDAPPVLYRERVVADAGDRVSWLRERARGVTATDVARLTGDKAVRAVAMEKLLGVFELEKAVYELRYELNNRPDWISIPVAGIARMLEESVPA